ncbi:hypothetical protein SISSUDRAFT_118325 [Sistotremastrum suecicum HHB10207 ss-3]|uniref:Secreted protein n=1 Tax=Sistotremastrum suecicum HHB10207 ss-3 TaxID=1314776 RepID=A0A166B1Y4_9AGAM|nr:hypothetical protein SISSUDRAFT_118325 [Sistotremastrum suecicum HHB10207 ss-3]
MIALRLRLACWMACGDCAGCERRIRRKKCDASQRVVTSRVRARRQWLSINNIHIHILITRITLPVSGGNREICKDEQLPKIQDTESQCSQH